MYVFGVVTEIAPYAFQYVIDFVEVEPIRRGAFANRHGGVALHAEIAQFAIGFSLSPGIHRKEQRVFAGIGMHTAFPFFYVSLVAFDTVFRVHELFSTQFIDWFFFAFRPMRLSCQ